jgi:dipeptidyl aminopeptidase/acylaminoacyl peptidase
MRSIALFSAVLVALAAAPGRLAAQPAKELPLIPREVFFGNPDRTQVKLSPDGTQISWLAPRDGVLNVFVSPLTDLNAAVCVTSDTGRGIRQYAWAYTNAHIIYRQDQGGDENWKIFSVDLITHKTSDLTPFDTIPGQDGSPATGPDGKLLRPAAQIESISQRIPDEILIAINNRNPQYSDIYRVNLHTAELKPVYKNDSYAGFTTDDNDNKYKVRLAMAMKPDGGSQIFRLDDAGTPTLFQDVGSEDSITTNPIDFDSSGVRVYMMDSRGRNTAALTCIDMRTGKSTLIAEEPRVDIGALLVHPRMKTVQAVELNYDRKRWLVIDLSIKSDLAKLSAAGDGDLTVLSRSLDDTRWIISLGPDDGPTSYYLYERALLKPTLLFTNRKALENLPLAKMHPLRLESRDGMELLCYLTLPLDSTTPGDMHPKAPLPMVLLVHGGPWARDAWGYNPYHQWLANRGYAVLSVNFRGSTGFGKKFVNAGNREWAGKMHEDLVDAVEWAVHEKIADKDKIAIMGGSYGGYATLVGLTFTPDLFAAGVDIVGPSNITTLLNTVPPYWAPMIEMFTTRVGDHRTEEGRKFLESRSPLTFVDRIKKPLLIGQGANDARVKQSESDQIVSAMAAKNIPVSYVLFPDEGHGFQRPENSMAFNAVTEAFLAQHLGGRAEPIGDALSKSSAQIKAGAEFIPTLKPGH